MPNIDCMVIDAKRTKERMSDLASTFATLVEEKFMVESETIGTLPEDKQAQAKLFLDKQKERLNEEATEVRKMLQHYVDLLMLAEMGMSMPLSDDSEMNLKVATIMRHMCERVLAPTMGSRQRAAEQHNSTKH